MNCPTCHRELAPLCVAGDEAAGCPGGHGMWLEVERFREAREHADPDLGWMDFDIWTQPERFCLGERPRACPGCGAKMTCVAYGDTRVAIDVCAPCMGLWLDEDEFARIVKALEKEAAHKTVSEYIQASLKEAGEIVAGDKTLTEEWRDLKHVVTLLEYRLFIRYPKLLPTLINVGKVNPLD